MALLALKGITSFRIWLSQGYQDNLRFPAYNSSIILLENLQRDDIRRTILWTFTKIEEKHVIPNFKCSIKIEE